MISLISLPPLPYIVFELLRYKQEDVTADNQLNKEPESLDVIIMDVLPTQINYSFSGKNGYNVGIGDDNVTVVRGGQAPTKISLQGTFGQRIIRRGLNITDGFGRLKQFEKMFRKSQSLNDALANKKPDEFNYIYGMNFYDFTHLYWQAVNLDTFNINKNAQTNSRLPFYTVNLTGLGALIDATPKDPLLRNLKIAIKVQEFLEQTQQDVDDFINNSPLSIINEVAADLETLQLAMNVVGQMAGQYSLVISDIVSDGSQVINNLLVDPARAPFSFANLLSGG